MTPTADTPTIADAYLDLVLGGDGILQTQAPGGVLNEEPAQVIEQKVIRYSYVRGATAEAAGVFGSMRTINDDIIFELLTYLVTMSGWGYKFKDLRAGSNQIKTLLHKPQRDTAPTDVVIDDLVVGKVLWSKYLAPWKERIPDSNVLLTELGGFYQIAVRPVAV